MDTQNIIIAVVAVVALAAVGFFFFQPNGSEMDTSPPAATGEGG